MSQEYTPVDWVDETTSQQGTLINAERLDQMQTAHHYADGFEEVDAIPTEDPGVDYHKVVYCTADTTFYRWDGTQWTADIDDDTKRLLEEHEADHSNPHAVTKAQVGLGNADNTADLDKPVSTATAAALAGKVDKLGSSPAGSYTKVTVNAQGQVTAGSNPATLAEAGITDAYTKAQVDTKLGDGSVTKLGTADVGSDTKPIKLVGGVPTAVTNDLVSTTGAQTIAGDKTFTSPLKVEKDGPSIEIIDTSEEVGVTPSFPTIAHMQFYDKNGGSTGGIVTLHRDNGTRKTFLAAVGERSSATLDLVVEADNTKYVTAPARAYDPTHTTDVATIGTLDGYTPMVRTTGAQTIGGIKTFNAQTLNLQDAGLTTGTVPTVETYRSLLYQSAGAVSHGYLSFNTLIGGNGKATLAIRDYTGTNTNRCILELNASSTPNVRIPNQRPYNTSNTNDVATIGTLDAYTPMVRTTGAQTIAGTKTFEATPVVNSTVNAPPASNTYRNVIICKNTANDYLGTILTIEYRPNGTSMLYAQVRNSDGTIKNVVLAQGNVV